MAGDGRTNVRVESPLILVTQATAPQSGNYVARWDYNWLQRNEGDEFAVKSYPQVYYGRKSRYNLSGTVEQTGLPASINNLGDWKVDYSFSETGNA